MFLFWNLQSGLFCFGFFVVSGVFLMVSDALILHTKQINSFQKNYALLCIFSCFRLQPRWKAQTYWWIRYTVLFDYKCAAHFSYWCVSETNQKSSKPMISQYLQSFIKMTCFLETISNKYMWFMIFRCA